VREFAVVQLVGLLELRVIFRRAVRDHFLDDVLDRFHRFALSKRGARRTAGYQTGLPQISALLKSDLENRAGEIRTRDLLNPIKKRAFLVRSGTARHDRAQGGIMTWKASVQKGIRAATMRHSPA
jgi:hypothetical protein